jgi:hypothetical protein
MTISVYGEMKGSNKFGSLISPKPVYRVDLDTIEYGEIIRSEALKSFKSADNADRYAVRKAKKMKMNCYTWGSEKGIVINKE